MKNLSRPANHRLLAGVCAAIALRFGWSTTLVRVGWVILSLFPGPLWVVYVVLWIIIPPERRRVA